VKISFDPAKRQAALENYMRRSPHHLDEESK
jgi:hypothetical protein